MLVANRTTEWQAAIVGWCFQRELIFCDPGASFFVVESKVLTLAARAPYSDGVLMITARRSTMPQLWRVFATAIAPISSTSEKMSVSMMMGLGLSSVERQLAMADNKTKSARQRNDIDSIVASRSDARGTRLLGCITITKSLDETRVFAVLRLGADVRPAQPQHGLSP